MLVLSRYVSERIRLRIPGHPDIWIQIADVRGNKVRIGFTATQEVEVMREELLPPTEQFNAVYKGSQGGDDEQSRTQAPNP